MTPARQRERRQEQRRSIPERRRGNFDPYFRKGVEQGLFQVDIRKAQRRRRDDRRK